MPRQRRRSRRAPQAPPPPPPPPPPGPYAEIRRAQRLFEAQQREAIAAGRMTFQQQARHWSERMAAFKQLVPAKLEFAKLLEEECRREIEAGIITRAAAEDAAKREAAKRKRSRKQKQKKRQHEEARKAEEARRAEEEEAAARRKAEEEARQREEEEAAEARRLEQAQSEPPTNKRGRGHPRIEFEGFDKAMEALIRTQAKNKNLFDPGERKRFVAEFLVVAKRQMKTLDRRIKAWDKAHPEQHKPNSVRADRNR